MAMLWIMLILILALVLGTAIDRLMERMGIQPADPAERSRGFRDVVLRVQAWVERRRAERP
jgi:hypothetical protein